MLDSSRDRTLKRLQGFIPIDVFFEGSPISDNARIIDMTATGAFIEIDYTVDAGSFITIDFNIMQTDIKCRAIVKWSGVREGRKGMGIEFENATKQQKIALYKAHLAKS